MQLQFLILIVFAVAATILSIVTSIAMVDQLALLFFIVALFYGVMSSVGAVLLEEMSFQRYPKPGDLALLLSFGVPENFGYRQLRAWWRVKAFWDYFRGKKSWGKMERKGFTRASN